MFNKAVVAMLALFALSLPAAAQEPTNSSRAATLIADASWSESDVTEYIYLVTTRSGRAVLLPVTTQGGECERQVAALDDLRLRLQAHPQIANSLTEERLAAMREDALQVGACRGVVAQIDRISAVRIAMTSAPTTTQVASSRTTRCDFDTWQWDSPVCASSSISSNAMQRYSAFFEDPDTTQCQLSTVWRLAQSSGWQTGLFAARHYLDTRFDGRVLDESVCGRTVYASAS